MVYIESYFSLAGFCSSSIFRPSASQISSIRLVLGFNMYPHPMYLPLLKPNSTLMAVFAVKCFERHEF